MRYLRSTLIVLALLVLIQGTVAVLMQAVAAQAAPRDQVAELRATRELLATGIVAILIGGALGLTALAMQSRQSARPPVAS